MNERTAVMGAVIFILALLPRVAPGFGTFINIDAAARWILRTKGFLTVFDGANIINMIQAPHPGVTLMWLMSAAEALLQNFRLEALFANPIVGYISILKLPLIITLSLLVAVVYVIATKLVDRRLALLIGVTLALEPLLLVYSRYLHLDALLSLLLLAGLLLSWKGIETSHRAWLMAAGACMALAVLTRLNGGIGVVFVVVTMAWVFRRRLLHFLRTVGWFALGGIMAVAMLWPVAIIAPDSTYTMLSAGVELGLSPHEVPANVDTIPWVRWMLYPIFIATRTPEIVLVAALAGLFFAWRSRSRVASLMRWLSAFAMLYLIAMTVADKHLDRYALPAVGPLVLLAGYGWWSVTHALPSSLRRKWFMLTGAMAALTLVQVGSLAPYFQTYQNGIGQVLQHTPVRTSAAMAPSWGEGMYDAVDYLRRPDGSMPSIAAWTPGLLCIYAQPYDRGVYPFRPDPVRDCPDEIRGLERAASADYIVFARQQVQQRVYPRLLADIESRQWAPEHVVRLNGVPYVWIFRNEGGLAETYTLQ